METPLRWNLLLLLSISLLSPGTWHLSPSTSLLRPCISRLTSLTSITVWPESRGQGEWRSGGRNDVKGDIADLRGSQYFQLVGFILGALILTTHRCERAIKTLNKVNLNQFISTMSVVLHVPPSPPCFYTKCDIGICYC